MRVTMRHQISGVRDGVPWPPPGKSIELPDAEAAAVIQSGMARLADDEPGDSAGDDDATGDDDVQDDDERDEETATARGDDVETATARRRRTRPRNGAPGRG